MIVYRDREYTSLEQRHDLFGNELIYAYCTFRRIDQLPKRPSNQTFGFFSNSDSFGFFDPVSKGNAFAVTIFLYSSSEITKP